MHGFHARAALAVVAILFASAANGAPDGMPTTDHPVYVVAARRTIEGVGEFAREMHIQLDSVGTPLAIARIEKADIDRLSRYVHENEQRCGGFFAFPSLAQAEAFIAGDRSAHAIAQPLGNLYTIDNHATVDAWLPQVGASNIHATIASLSTFRNRYYSSPYGQQAANAIRDTWQALAAARADASVELFTGCSDCSTQPSVIMTVQGTDLADEVVVVGAHLDSINVGSAPDAEQVAPGADDDASGIATITEIIRIALSGDWKPRRTVKFMGYAAEEIGLYGSRAIADRFSADGVDVVGVMQLDMTNYKDGASYDMQLISDYSNESLKTYLAALFDEYLAPLGMSRTSLACNYGCSDHASWTTAGYPAAMMFEAGRPRDPGDPWDFGDFPYIHSSSDTLANMGDSAENSVKFTQLGLAFVGELAKTATSDVIFTDGFEG